MGCGEGRLARSMAAVGYRVVAIDPRCAGGTAIRARDDRGIRRAPSVRCGGRHALAAPYRRARRRRREDRRPGGPRRHLRGR
ncbi:MAG: hypothetical protein M3124_03960 [Actinomycetota bacterium]|nr:hypothetical protein [Actinomycetota bacterium]